MGTLNRLIGLEIGSLQYKNPLDKELGGHFTKRANTKQFYIRRFSVKYFLDLLIGQKIRTQDCWEGSANAFSVLCRPPNILRTLNSNET